MLIVPASCYTNGCNFAPNLNSLKILSALQILECPFMIDHTILHIPSQIYRPDMHNPTMGNLVDLGLQSY